MLQPKLPPPTTITSTSAGSLDVGSDVKHLEVSVDATSLGPDPGKVSLQVEFRDRKSQISLLHRSQIPSLHALGLHYSSCEHVFQRTFSWRSDPRNKGQPLD